MSKRATTDFDLAYAATIRPVSIDDMSLVRYLHASAFRYMAAGRHSEHEIEAFRKAVYSAAYADCILATGCYAAWIEGEMIGTAGWCPSDDTGLVARITNVFVRPLFSGGGLGRLLTQHAEERARRAGFKELSVRATLNATQFFERLGYEISAHGVQSIAPAIDLPVLFMRKCVGAEGAGSQDGKEFPTASPVLALEPIG